MRNNFYFARVFGTVSNSLSRAHEAHEDQPQHLDRASVTDDVTNPTNDAEAPEQQVLEREPGGVLGGQPLSRREDEGGDWRALQLDRHERRHESIADTNGDERTHEGLSAMRQKALATSSRRVGRAEWWPRPERWHSPRARNRRGGGGGGGGGGSNGRATSRHSPPCKPEY